MVFPLSCSKRGRSPLCYNAKDHPSTIYPFLKVPHPWSTVTPSSSACEGKISGIEVTLPTNTGITDLHSNAERQQSLWFKRARLPLIPLSSR